MVPALGGAAAIIGLAGVYASAKLYVVPGRPAWNSPLTVVRFFATAAALGPALTGRPHVAVVGAVVALAATALNWARLARDPSQPWLGAVRLELRWFGGFTAARWLVTVSGAVTIAFGWTVAGWVLVACGELLGRWLFFVSVVPLNMPGAFWRGAAGSHR